MIRLRLPSTLLVLLALVLALGACGGSDDDEGGTSASTTTAPQSAGADAAPGEAGAQGGAKGEADAAGPAPSPDGNAAGGGGSKGSADVNLSVDPSRIRGAVVTETGAVQTLEPDSEAQETAQENSYSSIKAFGEEAEGEEATNITFGLVQYLDAKVNGDGATACARLYSVLREALEKQSESGSCPERFEAMMARASKANHEEQAKIDVSSVRRGEGNRAFVIYKTPQTLSADMPMYVEDGIWKVGALEAYVLRPEQLE